MEYYCIMVTTGKERIFKDCATKALQNLYPEAEVFFFERTLRSNRGEYFERPLFPGYVFLKIERLDTEVFNLLKKQEDFYRILYDNQKPTKISGEALRELEIFIRNGEHWGVSKVKILPGMKIQAVSGPFTGLEGLVYRINRKKKCITIITQLTGSVKYIDMVYEDVTTAE